MFESGNIELDVVDAGELGVLSLSQKGALEKINYKSWKLTNPDDFDPAIRRDDMLADISSGAVDLEFALLADGVPRDKIYPINVDRAFKSLDRVRPGIRKFWD